VAASHPGRLDMRMGGPQRRSGRGGEVKKFPSPPLPGNEAGSSRP